MGRPSVQRSGESWVLSWDEHHIGMGLERPREITAGLEFEVTVESRLPVGSGRVIGPVRLNLLSNEAQQRFATRLANRVNGLPPATWDDLVVQACAIVAKEYRAPTPTIYLNNYDDEDEDVDDYLFPELIRAGETNILYGDGGSAKSLLALRFGLSAMTGVPMPWGLKPTRTVNTLVLDWETNHRTMRNRLERLCNALRVEQPAMGYRGTVRGRTIRLLRDELPSLKQEVEEHEIGLVIVDSIAWAVAGSLNDDQVAREAINDLRELTPATRLVIAHLNKEAADRTTGPVRPFGSAFFWNGMRSGIEVRKAEDQPRAGVLEVGLFHRKGNDDELVKPIGLEVHFDGRLGPIAMRRTDIHEVADLAIRTSLSSRITAALATGAMDTTRLADECDATEKAVRTTLGRMENVVQLHAGGGRGHPATWGLMAR